MVEHFDLGLVSLFCFVVYSVVFLFACCCLMFDSGSHCVALGGLELIM